eukprot:2276998-Rhodomonas_salina.2
MDKEWKDWLQMHKKVMKMQGKADQLKEMQRSAKEHLEEMKTFYPAGADEKKLSSPAMFHNGMTRSGTLPEKGRGEPALRGLGMPMWGRGMPPWGRG